MLFTEEHNALKNTVLKIMDEHINPYVQEWEKAEIFPAHKIMKIMGDAGLLGISKPEKYGGQGLDFTYEMVLAETLGGCRANGVSTSIGVQTSMCTPALTKHGSEELKQEFLVPTIAGDVVGCIGVSEEAAGSDVASTRTHARRDGRGKEKRVGSPDFAAFSTAGPPGKPRPSILAVLSNASPTA